jgi:hypothetical protein
VIDMFYCNGKNAADMYIGRIPVQRLYMGRRLVWQRESPEPPSPYDRFPDNCVTVVRLDAAGNETGDIRYFYRTDQYMSEFQNMYNWIADEPDSARFNVYAGNDIGHMTVKDRSILPSSMIKKVVMFKYPSKWDTINYPYEILAAFNSYGEAEIRDMETVVLPELINTLPNKMFYKCISLKNVIFRKPSNDDYRLQIIEQYAFDKCYALTDLDLRLRNGYNRINSNAIIMCNALQTITINRPENSVANAPWGAPSTCTVIWTG